MQFFVAPLEGVTTFTFRAIHHDMFPGADTYYAPFIQPKQTHVLETSEKKNVAPENNNGINLVPQIMANKPELFNWAFDELASLGYNHVNLNLGCPRATIVTRKKGSGMLANLDLLASFLDQIFDDATKKNRSISIKTRLGIDSFYPAEAIIERMNHYPLEWFILHPRTQKDMYKNAPSLDVFEQCLAKTKHRICYNGNLFCRNDYQAFIERFGQYQQIEAVMPARGLIANPALIREIQGGKRLSFKEFKAFHDALYEAYRALNYGPSAHLHRMKELWFYWKALFLEQSQKMIRNMRIAKTIEEYDMHAKRFFSVAPKLTTDIPQTAF